MTAVTSKRELILEYIRKNVLTKINGEGDYNFNIKLISRDFREPKELKKYQFPSIFIIDDMITAYNPLTAQEITTGNNRADLGNGMNIALIGYVKQPKSGGLDSEGGLSTKMNQMFSDILIAMYDDYNMNNNALGIEIVSSRNMIQYQEDGDVGFIILIFSIKYDFNPSAKIT
jgi:hypothetical protein